MPTAAEEKVMQWRAAREKEWNDVGLETIQAFYQLVPSKDLDFKIRTCAFDIQRARAKLLGHDATKPSSFMEFDLGADAERDPIICLRPVMAQNQNIASKLSVPSRPMDWKMMKRIVLRDLSLCLEGQKLDPNIIFQAFHYFNIPRLYRSMSIAPPESYNGINKGLPVELQLMLLDNMSPRECDDIVRTSLPHVLHKYLPSAVTKFNNWFEKLCSPENIRYIGFYKGIPNTNMHRLHAFRFRSMVKDRAPGIRLRDMPPMIDHLPGPRNDHKKVDLMGMLEGLYLNFKANEPETWIERQLGDQREVQTPYEHKPSWPRHSPEICARIASAHAGTGQVVTDVPLIIPFRVYSNTGGLIRIGLLIYESELREIFAEMDVVMRPSLFKRGIKFDPEEVSETSTRVDGDLLNIMSLLAQIILENVQTITTAPQQPEDAT